MLRIGIAGLNRGSSFIGLFNARPDAQVAAVCANTEATLAHFSKSLGVPGYTDYDEFCGADIDAIVVATPPLKAPVSSTCSRRTCATSRSSGRCMR